jgi:hypothetical protein
MSKKGVLNGHDWTVVSMSDDAKKKLLEMVAQIEGAITGGASGDVSESLKKAELLLHEAKKATSPQKLKLSKKMVQTALEKARGNLSKAAEALGVSRQTIYTYMNRYPELKDIRTDSVEYVIDIAEDWLEEDVLKGDQRAYEFYLKYRGKGRGYTLASDVKVEGALQLPADVVEMMREHNIALADVARELEIILRAAGDGG